MEKKNKDILKKGLMETNSDFTSELMNRINAEEKALSSVLSKHGSVETSEDFTVHLMSKLEGKVPSKPYRSVISKPVWMGITAIFVAIVVLALSTIDQEASTIKYDLQVERIADGVATFFKKSSFLTYTCFGVLVFTLKLLYDQRSRKTT